MINIESNFIINPESLRDQLEENNSYQIIFEKQVAYENMGQQTSLWVNSGGPRGFGMEELGSVRILEATHFPDQISGGIYTRVKFEVISLKNRVSTTFSRKNMDGGEYQNVVGRKIYQRNLPK